MSIVVLALTIAAQSAWAIAPRTAAWTDLSASPARSAAPEPEHPSASVSGGDGGMFVLRYEHTLDRYGRYVIHRIGPSGHNLWGASGVAVTPAGVVPSWPLLLEDGQGGAILAWSDDAETQGVRLVRAQRVGADGTLRWPANGVRFRADTTGQFPIAATSDGQGGLFVLWEPLEHVFESPLTLARVAADGTLPWTPKPAIPGERLSAAMAADGMGGVLVSYAQFDEATLSYSLKVRRIGAQGTPVWPDTTRTVDPVFDSSSLSLASDGSGGAFVAWRRWSHEPQRVQRVSEDGGLAWGPEGIALSEMPPFGGSVTVLSDGLGGAIVHGGIARALGLGYDTQFVLQRFGPDGTRLWPSTGVALAESTYDASLRASADGAGGLLLGWNIGTDQRNAFRLQRIDATGTLRRGAHGVVVGDRAGRRVLRDVQAVGDGGVVVGWDDGRGSWPVDSPFGDFDPYVQRLSADGLPLWEPDGVCVYAKPTGLSDPLAVRSRDGCMVVWQEKRGTDMALLARAFDRAGSPRWPAVTVSPSTGARGCFALAPDGIEGALLAWADTHTGRVTIRAQRLDAYGAVGWGPAGLALVSSGAHGAETAIGATADGGAIVAWLDQRDDSTHAFAQRVTPEGGTVWASCGVPVSSSPAWRSTPSVFVTSTGGATIAWAERRAWDWNAFAQRLDESGAMTWPPDGLQVATVDEYPFPPDLVPIVPDGSGGLYCVTGATLLQRRDSTGATLWRDPGVSLHWYRPGDHTSLTRVPTGGVYATWFESDGAGGEGLYTALVAAGGYVQRGDAGGLIAPVEYAWLSHAVAVPDSSRDAIVLWYDSVSPWNPAATREAPIHAQRVDAGGAHAWPEGGIALKDSAAAVSGLSALSDGEGGAFVFWEERLADLSRTIRMQHLTVDGDLDWGAGGIAPDVASIETPPLAGTLFGIRPSPARGPFTVSFALAEGAPARLEVFDIGGRRVDERALDGLAPGRHTLTLGDTRPLRPGLYLVSLVQGGHRETRRVAVLR